MFKWAIFNFTVPKVVLENARGWYQSTIKVSGQLGDSKHILVERCHLCGRKNPESCSKPAGGP